MKRFIIILILSFCIRLNAQTWKTSFESEGNVMLYDAVRTSENETVLVGFNGGEAWMVKLSLLPNKRMADITGKFLSCHNLLACRDARSCVSTFQKIRPENMFCGIFVKHCLIVGCNFVK